MSSRVRAAYRTGRSGRVTDRHLGRSRYPDQNPESWSASAKGVIRYALVSHSKTYRECSGDRECARRRRQIAAGSLREANGLVRS